MPHRSRQSLFYVSEATTGLDWEDALAIARAARPRNAAEGISGFLAFDGATFVQLIDGSEAALADLLQRLRADPRHRAIEVLHHGAPLGLLPPHDWHLALLQPMRDEMLDTVRGRPTADAFRQLEALLPEGALA